MDGFNSYEGSAKLWIVYHDQGTTHVHATSEAIALQRFMAKYPNRTVKKIVRTQYLHLLVSLPIETVLATVLPDWLFLTAARALYRTPHIIKQKAPHLQGCFDFVLCSNFLIISSPIFQRELSFLPSFLLWVFQQELFPLRAFRDFLPFQKPILCARCLLHIR